MKNQSVPSRTSHKRHTRRLAGRTHRLCATMVILREGKNGPDILLVHKPRRSDTWQLPQGGVEPGESPAEAGKRELAEETGIKLKHPLLPCPQSYSYHYPAAFIKRERPLYRGQHLMLFAAVVPKDTPVHVDHRELDDFRWVMPSMIHRYIKRKNYRKVVQNAIGFAIKNFF